MMPHLRKHALLPTNAGQRSPPSSVLASQASQPASFFLRRRPAPALRALPFRLSPVLTLPPTCQSAEEVRESRVRATKRDAPRHATAALPLASCPWRGRGLEVVVDGTGRD
jgi:hypothetical protein